MASRPPADAHTVPPGAILLVVHDFIARSPDELSLAKGDRIELIERDDDFGDGWFLGRHMTNGSTGLFPEVYTTPAPKATLPISSNQQRGPRLSPLTSPFVASPESTSPVANDDAPLSSAHQDANSSRYASDADANARYSSSDVPAQRPLSSSSAHANSRAAPLSMVPAGRITSQSASHNSVMHETLSVIDEHITDLRTPRQSYLTAGRNNNHDADSVYSSHDGRRLSYINGHETDEEEQHLHGEAEVMAWTPARVAEYLEDHGVEKQHCEIFREQEISGEVLLHMEQSAVFIKEFELGSVGRRLKTWQKVKALQDEVRAAATPGIPRSVSDYSVAGDDSHSLHVPDGARSRSASIPAIPQRPLTATAPTASSYTSFPDRPATSTTQPTIAAPHLQSMTSTTGRPESMARPSAASIRSLGHSRRHSSVGSIDAGPPPSASRFSHVRHGSSSAAAAAAAARRRSSAHEQKFNSTSSHFDNPASLGDYGFGTLDSPLDLDRGYFSGNEVDNRNKRNVLQKKSSPSHSRTPSAATDSVRHSTHFRNHGRVASAESIREPVSPILSPSSAQFPFNRLVGNRAVSSPQATAPAKPLGDLQGPASPIVTKLDYGQSTLADSDASSVNPSPSPASHSFSFFSKPRIGGLRIASDAVTQSEKRAQSGLKGSPITSPTRTGSTTPSTTDARSLELSKPDAQSRVSTGSSSALAPPPSSTRSRPKPKTKKTTSAYTRGLERKPPAEQIADCDYSGWMKKKSSNLMGSWKPRLFVLRGRRLSYYYSENDTEEKGLIDISSHRVLPAENERITGLHAALTGASSSPIAPLSATTPTSAASDLASKPSLESEQGLFIFKLVPPRQGLSKAVNFTKPAVHYFAVNSRQEGRLWMAALMKATIDYDASGKVVTSYSQKTISLAKARARNERPPALREIEQEADEEKRVFAELEGESSTQPPTPSEKTGLGIDGLDAANGSGESATVPGAEKDTETTSPGTAEQQDVS